MAKIKAKIRISHKHAQHRMHPNSLANLRPPQPGENRNPFGRPPIDVSLTSLLKIELEKVPPTKDKNGKPNTRTWRELLVQAWLIGAVKNPILLKEILDRTDGKVSQPIRVSLDVRAEAERLAEELGLEPGEVIKEAERIMRGGHPS